MKCFIPNNKIFYRVSVFRNKVKKFKEIDRLLMLMKHWRSSFSFRVFVSLVPPNRTGLACWVSPPRANCHSDCHPQSGVWYTHHPSWLSSGIWSWYTHHPSGHSILTSFGSRDEGIKIQSQFKMWKFYFGWIYLSNRLLLFEKVYFPPKTPRHAWTGRGAGHA